MKVEKMPDNTFSIQGFNETELMSIYKKTSANKTLATLVFGNKVELLLSAIEKAIVIHT